jgi:pyruvate dehydrogenase E2 component (dihydrolipoamide acetyltransferase)
MTEGFALERPSATMRAMARKTAEAKATVPHFYIQRNVDMTGSLSFRAGLNEARDPGVATLSVNDLVLRACALALSSHHALRRSWSEQGFVCHEHGDIGIAVALDDGALVVPVLRKVERMSLAGLASQARDLVSRARLRQLVPAEMGDAAMTVSNLGMLGVSSFAAIINPPEASILAVGAIEPFLRRVDGVVVDASRMTLTLSVDHRVCAGVDAARFLVSVTELLEAPEALT